MTKLGSDGHDHEATHHIDAAVARYREHLSREADLGRARLDEIEDHMRLLIDDLQASGMPTAKAITEAARRLGDPREVAREHARVRTSFGAKLPLWRALAVIALVLPQLMDDLTSPRYIDNGCGVLGLVLCAALTWRSAWARAALFGAMAYTNLWTIASLAWLGDQPEAWLVALQLGAFGLLAPWRKADLTAPGWAIVLMYPMFSVAPWLLLWDVTSSGGYDNLPSMWFAVIGILLTGAGLVLRARWATVTACVATFVMTCWFSDIFEDRLGFPSGPFTLTMIALAIVAGIAIAFLASRTARSNVGDVKNIFA